MKVKLLHSLRRLLFPRKCIFCGVLLEGERQVCPCCMEKVVLRGTPARRSTDLYVDASAAALYYTGAVRRVILNLKYGERQSAARALAKIMQEASLRQLRRSFDLITYVPGNPGTERSRGYNQAGLLAQELSKISKTPCIRTLRKTRSTRKMHGLKPDERRENVRDAYALCCANKQIEGKAVLLVDDVLTTGATLSECAKVLKAGGAAAVYGICAASSRENDENFTNF